MPDLSWLRRVIDHAFPKGPPYEPDPDGSMHDFRNGTANNLDTIRVDVESLAFIRDPQNTPLLSDLEREYGIKPADNLTEQERRDLLKPERYKKATTGNVDDLQTRLDQAGFDLTAYQNSPDGPAIDPDLLLAQNFQMQAMEGTNYYAGNDLAYAGFLGGELLVNGNVFEQAEAFFGAGTMWAGNTTSVAGYFEERIQTKIEYPIPFDPDNWPFVFFVGGDATFNPDGSIATIEQGLVPAQQRKRLEDIILKFKPLFTWCGLIVTFT